MNNKNEIHNRREFLEIRRELRNNPTPEEEKLWQSLKNKQYGYKIRRQHSIEDKIVDFYCATKRLAIELDGSNHFTKEGKENDKMRDAELELLNIKVLRFPNSMVNKNIDQVLKIIKKELDKR